MDTRAATRAAGPRKMYHRGLYFLLGLITTGDALYDYDHTVIIKNMETTRANGVKVTV